MQICLSLFVLAVLNATRILKMYKKQSMFCIQIILIILKLHHHSRILCQLLADIKRLKCVDIIIVSHQLVKNKQKTNTKQGLGAV